MTKHGLLEWRPIALMLIGSFALVGCPKQNPTGAGGTVSDGALTHGGAGGTEGGIGGDGTGGIGGTGGTAGTPESDASITQDGAVKCPPAVIDGPCGSFTVCGPAIDGWCKCKERC